MTWTVHFIVGGVIFFINLLHTFIFQNFPSFGNFWDNLVVLYSLIGIVVALGCFCFLKLFKIAVISNIAFFLVVYYLLLIFLSGFFGNILWLIVTGTEL